MLLLASFLSNFLNVSMFSGIFCCVAGNAELTAFFMFSSAIIGTIWGGMAGEIEHQKPKYMMIGLLGTSFWLTVHFIGYTLYWFDRAISLTLLFESLWWYTLSFSTFFSGDFSHLERDSEGVKVNWVRVICVYFATLPLFLFATKLLWINGAIHFCVFLFYFEACMIHRTTKFRKFETDGERLFSRYYYGKTRIGEVEVSEEDRKELAYRILNSVDFLTTSVGIK